MSTENLPTRSELFQLPDWPALKQRYANLKFNDRKFEAVEEHGVRSHQLDQKLPNLEDFWRFHVAPATLRPQDTRFAHNVRQVTSRMAERSYEVYCNICDALDELRVIAKPPRYRACLNVLRCIGDAFVLFDELVNVIRKNPYDQQTTGAGSATLDKILGCKIELFRDWSDERRTERQVAITYRHMLVHHGRPWLHFEHREFEGYPYVLKAEHCLRRTPGEKEVYVTWAKQIEMFRKAKHRDKFILLPEACKHSCDTAIAWIDKGYSHIVSALDEVLFDDRVKFIKYRSQWGTIE